MRRPSIWRWRTFLRIRQTTSNPNLGLCYQRSRRSNCRKRRGRGKRKSVKGFYKRRELAKKRKGKKESGRLRRKGSGRVRSARVPRGREKARDGVATRSFVTLRLFPPQKKAEMNMGQERIGRVMGGDARKRRIGQMIGKIGSMMIGRWMTVGGSLAAIVGSRIEPKAIRRGRERAGRSRSLQMICGIPTISLSVRRWMRTAGARI
mmetsp:Transcript_31576/g.75676  ORF Transcript_31576/g.75676 Transcript_31576/m.75676 type:complete len:206 (-) Transcript_31576:1274-1891(-)